MILNYDSLPLLAGNIKDYIANGQVTLYVQPEKFDNLGTRFLLMVSPTLIFRLRDDGNFILPPLTEMPQNADLTDSVVLRRG